MPTTQSPSPFAKSSLFSGSSLRLACCVLLYTTPALADPNSKAVTPAEQEIEVITVQGRSTALALDATAPAASRLGLSQRELPASLSVMTQQRMQLEGLRSSIEALKAAPGVNAGALPGSVGVSSMRGFTDNAIAYLFDGVRVTGSNSAIRNFDTFNFERVEVLKGPASVLYGEGALAGAINLVPKRARLDSQSLDLLLSAGSYQTLRAGIGGNTQLTDNAALRLDASASDSDGWADDTHSETQAVTSSVVIAATDRLTLNLFTDYFRDNSSPYFGSTLVPAAVALQPDDQVSGPTDLVLDKATRRTNYNVLDGVMNSESWQVRAKADYLLTSQWTLSGELAGYTADRLWRNVEDVSYNSSTGLMDRNTTQISHDHQYLSGRGWAAYDGELAGQRARLSFGAELSDTSLATSRRFGVTTPVDRLKPQRGYFPEVNEANFPGAGNRVEWQSDSTTQALFAEAAYNLTNQLLLVAGLRYDDIELHRSTDDLNTAVQTAFGQDYAPLSGRLGLVYDLTADTNLYAQYSHAVTPVSSFLLMNSTNAKFDLSSGDAFELGIKTSFWQDKGDLTASVYQITQDDIVSRDPENPSTVIQGGQKQAYGAELALSAALTAQWRLDASLALLNAELTDLIESGGADRSGNRPPNVVEQQASLSTYYQLQPWPLTLGLTVRHNGDFYTNNANSYKVEGHTLVDAQLIWQSSLGRFTLRGRNLTDELYADWSGYGPTQLYLGAPRSVDFTYSRSF